MSSSKTLNPDEKIRIGEFGNKVKLGGLAVGLIGIGVAAAYGATRGDDMRRFFNAYLIGLAFCTSLALGALWFVLLMHLVRARWSVAVRRIASILSQTMPVLGILAAAGILIPMLAGNHSLYIWSNHDIVAGDHLLHGKSGWLNVPFFCVRIAAYFTIWTLIARYFFKKSVEQDESGDPAINDRLKYVAGPTIVLYGITCGFAGIDLLMTLTPHWYSTMWPIYWFSGCGISMAALLIIVPRMLQSKGLLRTAITTEHYHDTGKWLFAFVMFWAYIAFSQYMLDWYADLPEETIWFKVRMFEIISVEHVNWKPLSFILLVGHFVFPFVVLISRETKRRLWILTAMAVYMLVMHLVDLYWIVMPGMDMNAELLGTPVFHWSIGSFLLIDVAAIVGVCGIFFASAAMAAQRVNLVPTKDRDLGESLAFENY